MNPENQKRFLSELTEPPDAIAPDKVAFLAGILERVEREEIEFDQRTYHCWSKHCLAGWIEVKALEDAGYEPIFDLDGDYGGRDGIAIEIDKTRSKIISPVVERYRMTYQPTYDFARDWLGINVDESELLFAATTSLELQKELVRLFGLGYRFYLRDGSETLTMYAFPEDMGTKEASRAWISTYFENGDREMAFVYPNNLIDFCTKAKGVLCPTP